MWCVQGISNNLQKTYKNLQKLVGTYKNLSKLPKTYLVLNLNLRWTSIKVKKSCKYICMSFKSLNFPNFKTTVSVEADVHGDCDTQQTELRKRGKGSPWKVVFHSDNVQRRMQFFPFCNLRLPWSVRAEFAEASLAMFSL